MEHDVEALQKQVNDLIGFLAKHGRGRDGRDGRDGADGRPGDPGPRGMEGSPGKPGEKGIAGIAGAPGPEGKRGLGGAKGDAGEDGAAGEPGATGPQGEKGQRGYTGAKGDVGPQGPPGPRGPIGPIPRHEWDGTKLRFEVDLDDWGPWVDLRGPRGLQGPGGGGGNNSSAPAAAPAPSPGGGSWGEIIGTLSDQTDLSDALDLKAPLASPDFTGAASYAGTLADLSTVEQVWGEGETHTIPDGVTSVLNTSTSQIYNLTLKMPATPINGQKVEISSLAEVRIFHHDGNGATITTPITGFFPDTTFIYRYRADATTWDQIVEPTRYESSTSGTRTLASLTGTGSLRLLNHLGLSWDLTAGFSSQPLVVSQATADGKGGRGNFLGYSTQNTLNVNDGGSDNGTYSWTGYQAITYNSSVAFGPSASNDDELILGLVNVGQMFAGGPGGVNWPAWNGAPPGIGNYLSFTGAFLRCGSPYGGGQAWEIDNTRCNFSISKALAITNEQRDTGSSDFTVGDNLTNVILAGSGTVTVTLPPNPIDGQHVNFTVETGYSAITIAKNGSTQTLIAGAAMGVTAGSFATWRYRLANTKWYRVG